MILTASWVAPVAAPPLPDGAVLVRDGRIAWVGRRADAPAGEQRDLGSGVLFPGLVNAHCHLELSHLGGGRVDESRGFVPWVRALVEERAKDSPETVRASTADAIATVAGCGTAAIADVSNTLDHLDLLSASPLAASLVLFEAIGFDPAHAEATLARALARLAAVPRYDRVDVRLAAHAPYSVSAPLMRGLAAHGLAALHLAESEAETLFLRDGSGTWPDFLRWRGLDPAAFAPSGASPVRHADALGALPRGLIAAHCVRVDAADRAVLAARGVHVAVCPRSNRHLDVGLPDVPALLEAGVGVALGTDSLASAGSLCVLDDAVALRRAFPGLGDARVLGLATSGGAAALRLGGELGAIAPGLRAAFAFAPCERGCADPLGFLLSGEAAPRRVPGTSERELA